MTIPQLLSVHIEELKQKGFNIDTYVEGNEIYIIFSKYTIPAEIWNRDTTDLMVKTNFAYPQAKMDMFWVTPGLRLGNGKMPQNGDVHEHYLSKEWQRFSWHPSKWTPGHDNLITFVEFVNHRLFQSR